MTVPLRDDGTVWRNNSRRRRDGSQAEGRRASYLQGDLGLNYATEPEGNDLLVGSAGDDTLVGNGGQRSSQGAEAGHATR